MRVLSVFGTRPEAIKMAPVVRALAQQQEVLSRVCVTGQHREMLDQVMATLALKADYDLNIMQPGQALGDVFARVLSGLAPSSRSFNPTTCWCRATLRRAQPPRLLHFIPASRSAMSRLVCAPET